MTDRNSFYSYIRNSRAFESVIEKTHSFYSYIRNQHTFVSEIIGRTTYEVLWSLKIIVKSSLTIANALMNLNIATTITIPKILATINSNIIFLEERISNNLNIISPKAIISAIMRFNQPMGNLEVTVPESMNISIAESFSIADTVSIPNVDVEYNMTALQYYLVSYYDASLLSDLDSNLLSDMDYVSV